MLLNLWLFLLITSVISCSSSSLTIEDLTADFVDGEYTLDNSPVRPHELLTALYRIAGEPEASRDFEVQWDVGEKGSYYYDAAIWSAFQAGITTLAVEVSGEASNHGVIYELHGFRVGDKTVDEIMANFSKGMTDCKVNKIVSYMNYNTDISRSDAVLAMYYFVTTYLGKDIPEVVVWDTFYDYEEFTKSPYTPENMASPPRFHNMYNTEHMYTMLWDTLSPSWNWAVGAGIIEGYPDVSLRPDATLTRAEFAEMLERFMDYVK